MQAYGHTMDFTKMVHLLRASWDAPSTAPPNLRTYNAAITACCRAGHLGRSLRLLHEMVGFSLLLVGPVLQVASVCTKKDSLLVEHLQCCPECMNPPTEQGSCDAQQEGSGPTNVRVHVATVGCWYTRCLLLCFLPFMQGRRANPGGLQMGLNPLRSFFFRLLTGPQRAVTLSQPKTPEGVWVAFPEGVIVMDLNQTDMLLQRALGIAPNLHTYTSLISGCGFARDPYTAYDLVRPSALPVLCPTGSDFFLSSQCEAVSQTVLRCVSPALSRVACCPPGVCTALQAFHSADTTCCLVRGQLAQLLWRPTCCIPQPKWACEGPDRIKSSSLPLVF